MIRLRSTRVALAFTIVGLAIGCGSEEHDGTPGPASGGQSGTAGDGGSAASGGAGASGAAGSNGSAGSAGSAASGGAGGSGGSAGATGSGGSGTGGSGTGGASGTGGGSGSLSDRYPGDRGIGSDPAVLFHDDFEAGWGRWDGPTQNTQYLSIVTDGGSARGGSAFLKSTVTTAHLEAQEYISSSTRVTFARRVDEIYWRFYARFPNIAPNPHHWIRMAAGDESYNSSGLANTVPPGDRGFWFDFDANNDDQFNFYVYWYKMRSGRCNDGSATPGCAGDQGSTYYYGNVFQPPNQQAFGRDRWFCIEIRAKANGVGSSNGELAFWIDDRLVGDYRPGHPNGTWLRAEFHTGGCSFSACTPPVPFEGFDFRSASGVGFKSIFLDAYYERNTSASKRAVLEGRGLTVSNEQTILYDDVVAATQRIGCVR